MRRYFIEIVENKTMGVEERIGPYRSKGAAYKAERSVITNLNRHEFFTRVVSERTTTNEEN